VARTPFKDDESQWIATSSFFEPFARGDFTNTIWRDWYWTRTQPPVTRYIIALGRLAGGYSPDALNKPWNWNRDEDGNNADGAMPDADLLWWSRLPMALLATVAGLCICYFARTTAGRGASYTAVLLIVANPYFLLMLCRAMSEAPLVAMILLASCAANQALKTWSRALNAQLSARLFGQWCAWFVVIGVCAGIAGGAKLNGLAVVAAGVALALVAVALFPSTVPVRIRLGWAVAGTISVLAATAIIFVAVNPFLYPDPFGHTLILFEQRLHEFQIQATLWPVDQVGSGRNRVQVIVQRVFNDYAALRGSWTLLPNIVVAGLGCVTLLQTAARARHGDQDGAAAVVLLIMGATVALPALATPLDWDRYYLLPIIWTTICSALRIGQLATLVWSRARHTLVPSPTTAKP
jgi:hypothetical protein